jgi:hypothetical protein
MPFHGHGHFHHFAMKVCSSQLVFVASRLVDLVLGENLQGQLRQ